MRQTTVKNIKKILRVLRETDLHIRGISRATGINPFVVSYIIDKYLSPFVDIKIINEFGIKAKIISLKRNVSGAEILRYVKFKKLVKERV